jgi:glucose/mannose-6-phosphate isomerase
MQEATLALPDQIEESMRRTQQIDGLPEISDIDQIVILGMGGSGIAGDIVSAIAGPRTTVPILVTKGYECPNFVNQRTLVMVASFSGETEETLHAASLAHERGAPIFVVTCGGTLEGLAEDWGASFSLVDSTIPMPRCAVGAMSVPLFGALSSIGLLEHLEAEIEDTVTTLRRRCDLIRDGSDNSFPVAESLAAQIPLIYGGGPLGGVAAVRFKNQINENAKAPAFFSVMPEMCHNELAGWGAAHSDKANIVRVHLRHAYEHPRLAPRFDFNETVARGDGSEVVTVSAEGRTELAQLFDLILFGDQTSLELAALLGQDPGPIDVLAELKHQLAR